MDTHVTIVWYGDEDTEAVDRAFRAMKDVEQRMSAYEPLSEVTAINAAAGEGAVRVSEDTFEVIALALEVAEMTGGTFDPTVFPLVEIWQQPLPSQEAIDEALAWVDHQKVILDPDTQQVELLETGMGLDLGGIAKGYAVDRAAQELRRAGIERALIDAGGDLYGLGQRIDDTPWRIAVQHPRAGDRYLVVVPLVEQAVVTSGDYQRYTEVAGVRYHHIYDPRTGWPADTGLISSTVLAPSADWADGLSTALFVLGLRAAMELVERLDGVEALLVTTEGETWVSSGLEDKVEILGW